MNSEAFSGRFFMQKIVSAQFIQILTGLSKA
jgi:hypothetical protein